MTRGDSIRRRPIIMAKTMRIPDGNGGIEVHRASTPCAVRNDRVRNMKAPNPTATVTQECCNCFSWAKDAALGRSIIQVSAELDPTCASLAGEPKLLSKSARMAPTTPIAMEPQLPSGYTHQGLSR